MAPARRKQAGGRRGKGATSQRASRPPKTEPVSEDAPSDPGDAAAVVRGAIPVIGVGASAGGLEAFSSLLGALPREPGFALVFVQHLSPEHESALPALLASVSRVRVVQATDGMAVEPNAVYVIPPNATLELADGRLRLGPRREDRSQYNPVDTFLRSLAEAAGDRAIAVVLSGTASDGAAGVRDVKAAGGIVLVQRPDTARYDGMPRAAIATGMVDLVLSPQDIAAELVHLSAHPWARPEGAAVEAPPPAGDDAIQRVFAILRGATGLDFGQYKRPTILRRLHRRMALQKIPTLDAYVEFLENTPSETQKLYRDLLINVTRFFREPESFDALAKHVFPQIVPPSGSDAPIRIWICGCATGEEAYSVAIALLEYLGDEAGRVPIQIFATDVSEGAIEHARTGSYPESIEAEVSPERLRRFFTKADGIYRVSKAVRDLCVFARQDLTRDPPFSRLDLILCRNVLIYMAAPLQRRLMAMFHYALKPRGFLALGQAETVGFHADLFSVVDKRSRIYARRAVDVAVSAAFAPTYTTPIPLAAQRPAGAAREDGRSLQSEANRIVLERYAPPGVLLDDDFQIVQFRGQTGRYLEAASGDPNLSVLKMAREGLLYGLRTALHAARKRNATVRREGLSVRANGGWREVDLQVLPVTIGDRPHYLVLFEEPAAAPAGRKRAPARKGRAQKTAVEQLQQELAASREHLQSIIQELEAANEELQSANEEILSSNEELQSTNEELDTAKEELQSTNEELNTVNEELHGRNEELSRVNSDLVNLLASVEIAIVIVAGDLRIRRFTPMAERVLNLIPGDVGRPISHIKPNVEWPDVEQMIAAATERVVSQEREVRDRKGAWYSLRVRPYKNVDNKIDGAVLTLFDIDASKRHEEEAKRARDLAWAVLETVREPLVVVDADLRIVMANDAFCDLLGLTRASATGRPLADVGGPLWRHAPLQQCVVETLRSGRAFQDLALDAERSGGGRTSLRVSGRRVEGPSVLLAFSRPPSTPGGEGDG